MFKTLSKSVFIMFIFDLLILFLSTLMWAYKFSYSAKAIIFLTLSVVVVGLIVLFLKGNYKIREFNITGKNTYLLFEGIVMMHVIPALYLLIFASSVGTTLEFLFANILTTFVCLRIYRALFLSLDSQNENCRTQNANISILRLVRGKYSNFVCHTF